MSNDEQSSDLSDACALLAAYAALGPRERQALLHLAQEMAPDGAKPDRPDAGPLPRAPRGN